MVKSVVDNNRVDRPMRVYPPIPPVVDDSSFSRAGDLQKVCPLKNIYIYIYSFIYFVITRNAFEWDTSKNASRQAEEIKDPADPTGGPPTQKGWSSLITDESYVRDHFCKCIQASCKALR